jgi:hypothetical protein
MSFLTDVLAAVGGSPSVLLVRYRGVGQTVVGGELQTWDDARGASGYGPTATGYGAPKPAVDVNGVVSCDGVQNHYSTGMQAIFDQTTPGTWIYLGIVPNNSVAIVMDSEPSTGYPNLDAIVGTGGRIEGYFSDGTSRGLTADGLQIVMKYWAGSSPSGGAHAGDSWKMLEVRGHVPSRPTNEGANPGLYGPKAYRIGDWTNGPGFHAATQEYFSMWVDHALSATEKTNLVALLKAEFPTAFIDTSKGYIIPDGDSRVAGATLADPVTEAWPAKMMVTLGLSATYEMMNAGVSSRSTATARTAFNKRLGGFYDASRTLHQIVMVSGSFINSLSEGATAASILADLIAHCTEARDLGNKVIVTTELPWVGGAGYPASDVNAHNAYIRAHRAEFADELADFALILTDPTDPTDWSDDQKHPNASGHNKLANTAVYGAAAAVTRLLSSLPPISGTGQGDRKSVVCHPLPARGHGPGPCDVAGNGRGCAVGTDGVRVTAATEPRYRRGPVGQLYQHRSAATDAPRGECRVPQSTGGARRVGAGRDCTSGRSRHAALGDWRGVGEELRLQTRRADALGPPTERGPSGGAPGHVPG